MAKKSLPTPEPVPKDLVCSVCGEPWHEDDPTLTGCIAALKKKGSKWCNHTQTYHHCAGCQCGRVTWDTWSTTGYWGNTSDLKISYTSLH